MFADEYIKCPFLNGEVELSSERLRHIAERHPELLPENRLSMIETLNRPDNVRPSARLSNARLFSKFYPDLVHGKHVVVVVISETIPQRHWVVTAYLTRKLAIGE